MNLQRIARARRYRPPRRFTARIGPLVGPAAGRTWHASCHTCRLYGNCHECDQLWAEFARANQRLLAAVETKYEQIRVDPLLESQVLVAIDDRQHAKQRLLAHQRWAHPG